MSDREKEFNSLFAKNLQFQIERNGLQQKELAEKLGVAPSTVTWWIKGLRTPRMDKVDEMCKILNCTRSDLLTDTSKRPESYYVNRYAEELANFLHESPEYKVLFDASRKIKPEDIDFVIQMLDRMGGNND